MATNVTKHLYKQSNNPVHKSSFHTSTTTPLATTCSSSMTKPSRGPFLSRWRRGPVRSWRPDDSSPPRAPTATWFRRIDFNQESVRCCLSGSNIAASSTFGAAGKASGLNLAVSGSKAGFRNWLVCWAPATVRRANPSSPQNGRSLLAEVPRRHPLLAPPPCIERRFPPSSCRSSPLATTTSRPSCAQRSSAV